MSRWALPLVLTVVAVAILAGRAHLHAIRADGAERLGPTRFDG